MVWLIVLGVVVVLVVSVVAWVISTRNSFIRMLEDIKNSESRIDVYLTKRFDDLTKMVDTVKGYTKHESETLTKIVEMRNPGRNASIEEKAEFSNALSQATKELNILVEQYPNLKADSLFVRLQDEISEIEENLQAARSNYNNNVSIYNKRILTFPSSIIAGNKFTKANYFEAEEEKKADVKISF